MTETNCSLEIISMTSEIVAGYVSNNQTEQEELPKLIQQIYHTLESLILGATFKRFFPTEPVVPIEESITPDYIVCLEDGLRLKMLKRHLKTTYNMTPVQYRERWGLPANYPMVAPNYTKRRSDIAKGIGLGTHRKIQKKKIA